MDLIPIPPAKGDVEESKFGQKRVFIESVKVEANYSKYILYIILFWSIGICPFQIEWMC